MTYFVSNTAATIAHSIKSFHSIRMETVISRDLRQIAPVNLRDYYASVLYACYNLLPI